MQARSAYISSLSTTAIMVASAVLMLALLGATVGFRHWPHGEGGQSIDSIGMSSQPSTVFRVSKVTAPKPAHHASAAAARPPAQPAAPAVTPAAAPSAASQPPAVGVVEVPPAPPARPEPTAPSGPSRSTAPPPQPLPSTPPPAAPAPPDPVKHLLEPLISPVTSTVGPVPVSLPNAQ